MTWRPILAASLALTLTAQPVLAYEMSDAERSLAYRVRIARGEEHYHLRQSVIDTAGIRANQIVTDFRHRNLHDAGLIPLRCGYGEVLAWTTLDDRRASTLWAINAWLASPSHRAVLLGRWDAYGTGATYRGGRWYFAVVFVDC